MINKNQICQMVTLLKSLKNIDILIKPSVLMILMIFNIHDFNFNFNEHLFLSLFSQIINDLTTHAGQP